MKRLVTVLSLGALLALPTLAYAQSTCGQREAIVERLTSKWGETFAGGGLQNANSVFEIWMSVEKGTWTILRTMPNGTACVMAAGTNWLESLPGEHVAGVKG